MPEVNEENEKEAVKKKELGNEAFKKQMFNDALDLYKEAIELDSTKMSFYNNVAGACSIFLLFYQKMISSRYCDQESTD